MPIQPAIVPSGLIKISDNDNDDDDYDGDISDDDNDDDDDDGDMPAKKHHDNFPTGSEIVGNDEMGCCSRQTPTIQLTNIGLDISQLSSAIAPGANFATKMCYFGQTQTHLVHKASINFVCVQCSSYLENVYWAIKQS